METIVLTLFLSIAGIGGSGPAIAGVSAPYASVEACSAAMIAHRKGLGQGAQVAMASCTAGGVAANAAGSHVLTLFETIPRIGIATPSIAGVAVLYRSAEACDAAIQAHRTGLNQGARIALVNCTATGH